MVSIDGWHTDYSDPAYLELRTHSRAHRIHKHQSRDRLTGLTRVVTTGDWFLAGENGIRVRGDQFAAVPITLISVQSRPAPGSKVQ